jgi:hypothetical protein
MESPYWTLLSADDAEEYCRLHSQFHDDGGRTRKGDRLEHFSDQLFKIRRYVESPNEGDWKRSLVCGVFFLPHGIALNIHRLRALMGKCKSSINGSLQQLGSTSLPQPHGIAPELLARIPCQHHDPTELRKWTVRTSTAYLSRGFVPFLVPVPMPSYGDSNVATEAIEAVTYQKFPCPVKWRYKFWDSVHQSVSSQTGA